MLRPKILALYLFIMTVVCGCMPVLKLIYGIHQPKVQNEDKLKKYLTKIEADTSNNYTVSSAGYIKTLGYIKSTFPEIMVFNQHGKLIPYKDNKACNASAPKFIELLDSANVYQAVDSVQLQDVTNNFTTLSGRSSNFAVADAGFTLLIFWAEFTGRLNKENTIIWEKAARKNSKSRINVYKVNLDLQEHWEEQERQEIINHLSKL